MLTRLANQIAPICVSFTNNSILTYPELLGYRLGFWQSSLGFLQVFSLHLSLTLPSFRVPQSHLQSSGGLLLRLLKGSVRPIPSSSCVYHVLGRPHLGQFSLV